MAISKRATSTGPNNSSTTTTINLPAGVTTNDVSFLIATNVSGGTMTEPSGWTVIAKVPGSIACYRAWQSGDPSSVAVTCSSSNWFESAIITYIGVDTTTPIDTSNSCVFHSAGVSDAKYRAPSLNPNFAGSQLLVGYTDQHSNGGGTLTIDGSLTSQVSSTAGPRVAWCDKALTDGTSTGNMDATWLSRATARFGIQVAIKASGASATTVSAPKLSFAGAQLHVSGAGTSFAVDFTPLAPATGDFVIVSIACEVALSSSTPSGYTLQQTHNTKKLLYTHSWTSGDTTSLTFTTGSSAFFTAITAIIRRTGTGALNPVFDQSSQNTGTTTVASTAMTPAGSAEMLLCFWGSETSTAGTWSSPPGSFATGDPRIETGPNQYFGWVQPAAVPTGTFSVTLSQSATQAVQSLLLNVGPLPSMIPFFPLKTYLRR